jgi:hypothetical protein
LPLFFNFAFRYAIRRVQVNQESFILNGTHQVLVCVDGVNIMGGSVHTINENTGSLIVAIEETGLEVNVDKFKCMVVSRDQNVRRSHYIKIFKSSLKGWSCLNIWE